MLAKTALPRQPICQLMMVTIALGSAAIAQENALESNKAGEPSVGVPGMIEQIVLPGTLLTHQKVDPSESDIVVRVIRSFPHGDSFRYDISYYGMESGEYDLSQYLIREDGSTTDDLPTIPVVVKSIIKSGQIKPNDLDIGMFGRVGGYYRMVVIGAFLWAGIFLALIFLGRGKKKTEVEQVSQKLSLADRLRPSIEAAISGNLPAEKHAELERMLFAFWQKRLKLSGSEPSAAIQQIRNNEESGPLIKQVEQWLHSPPQDNKIEVAELLRPYQNISADELDDLPSLDNVTSAATEKSEPAK